MRYTEGNKSRDPRNEPGASCYPSGRQLSNSSAEFIMDLTNP